MANSRPFADPELQLLIDACAPVAREPVAAAGLDWPRVVRLARAHRVYPRVWARYAPRFPEESAIAMRTLVAENSLRALRNIAHTIELVRGLRAAGIPAIVLKGPLLAHDLYGDVALRVAGDVDILVREADFSAAAAVLAGQGFRPETALTPQALNKLRRRQHDLGFTHPEDNSLIELHADIAQPHYGFQVDLEAWWNRRRDRALAGEQLCTLSPEHAYLLSALHAARHRWHRLDLAGDVAAHLQLGIDRAVIQREAREAWLLRHVDVGEEIAAWLFWEKLPLRYPARKAIAQMITTKEFSRMGGIRFDLALRPRAVEKARYIARRLLSAKLEV